MDIDEAQLHAEESMEKAIDYLKSELRGIRTGRASTGMVEFIKVDYYGSQSDLRSLAMINVPEPTQILIKPYDASSIQAIVKGIEVSGLGVNPIVDGKQIRINLPALTGERRKQLQTSVKHMGEQAKVTIRNARRDANKHIDAAGKDKTLSLSEDVIDKSKKDVDDLTHKYEKQVDDAIAAKQKEIEEV